MFSPSSSSWYDTIFLLKFVQSSSGEFSSDWISQKRRKKRKNRSKRGGKIIIIIIICCCYCCWEGGIDFFFLFTFGWCKKCKQKVGSHSHRTHTRILFAPSSNPNTHKQKNKKKNIPSHIHNLLLPTNSTTTTTTIFFFFFLGLLLILLPNQISLILEKHVTSPSFSLLGLLLTLDPLGNFLFNTKKAKNNNITSITIITIIIFILLGVLVIKLPYW